MKLLQTYHIIKKQYYHCKKLNSSFEESCKNNIGQRIHFYNWWPNDTQSHWLHDFIIKRGLLKSDKTIALCSVFGEKEMLDLVEANVKIFFSGENLHNPRHSQYAGYMLEGKRPYDLGIGFDYFDNERYIRFPLWVMYLFAPDSTEEDIRIKCEQLRYPEIGERNEFATLLARADWNGVRGQMADEMTRFGVVKYPSVFRHNDDSLKENFGDDKINYLKQFKFNICPENTNAIGYVTEKIFESIEAGCVPVYWGSYANPEPEVLNQDAIIMNIESSIINDYDRVSRLPRLKNGAEDYIIGLFHQLHAKLESRCK